MKNRRKGMGLPLSMVVFGSIAMVLRHQLYLTAVDGKGLLRRGSWLEILLLALTAAVFALVFLALRKDRGSEIYEENYSASVPSALGHVAAATGIFAMVRGMNFAMAGLVGLLWQPLGLASSVCLVLAGVMRLFGRKPFFLLHVVPCLFLMIYLVGSYQLWSSNPQLQDYLFALLAIVSLVLFSHFTASFEAGLGNRKLVLGSGLLAVYLCLAELGWTDSPGLYFGGMFWAVTGICHVSSAPEKE